MKVLCVNNKPARNAWNGPKPLSVIKEGEEYEGILDEGSSPNGTWESCWFIAEVGYKYDLSRFIPISSIDETEMQRAYSTIKVSQTVTQ